MFDQVSGISRSLGLFDVNGLTDFRPTLQIGSPVFSESVIILGNGKSQTIKADNNSKDNIYIQSASWNGKALHQAWLYREQLMQGGTLILKMGPLPNKKWGVKVPPPSVQ